MTIQHTPTLSIRTMGKGRGRRGSSEQERNFLILVVDESDFAVLDGV